MLTKNALGNLINRYKAVLKKCNLINVFGSFAAAMVIAGGAGMAQADYIIDNYANLQKFIQGIDVTDTTGNVTTGNL